MPELGRLLSKFVFLVRQRDIIIDERDVDSNIVEYFNNFVSEKSLLNSEKILIIRSVFPQTDVISDEDIIKFASACQSDSMFEVLVANERLKKFIRDSLAKPDTLDDALLEYITEVLQSGDSAVLEELLISHFPDEDSQGLSSRLAAVRDDVKMMGPRASVSEIESSADPLKGNPKITAKSSESSEDIATLQTMFSHLELGVIEHIYYNMSDRDVSHSANTLYDFMGTEDRLKQEKAQFDEKKRIEIRRKKAEQAMQKKIKNVIVEKYGEQEVLPKFDKDGNEFKKKTNAIMFINSEGGGNQKIRYRDNQIVTHSGQKVLIEKPLEYSNAAESSSSGKIKIKTKRQGWV